MTFKSTRFTVFDLDDAALDARRNDLLNTRVDAIIYVVDANAHGQPMTEAKGMLETLLAHECGGGLEAGTVPLLVFAHKADLPNAIEAAAVSEALGLGDDKFQDRPVEIFSSTGNRGDNLYEGLEWLVGVLEGRTTHGTAGTTSGVGGKGARR